MRTVKKEQTTYRHIIADAWKITWRRKELWVFGFFAVFAWGGGAINYIANAAARFSSGVPFVKTTETIRLFASELASPASATRIAAAIALLVTVVIFAIAVFASITSVGAILNAAAEHKADQKSNLRKDTLAGARSFSRIFAIILACRIIAIALLLIVGLAFSGYIFVSPLFWVLFIILFIIACLVSLFLWFVSSVASAGVAIDNLSIRQAVAVSFNLLEQHWLVCLETMVMLFAATIVAAIAIIATTIVLSLPFTILLFVAIFVKSTILVNILAYVGLAVGFAIIVVAGSALSVFTQATWALLYERLGTHGAVAKLERLFSKFKK